MTPAVSAAKKARIAYELHAYTHDPDCTAYGMEAVERLGLDAARVYKTLVVAVGERDLAVAVVPVAAQLDLKAFAKSVGAKKAAMADPALAERSTGYVLGGVSPLGQKKRLPTVVDASAQNHPTLFVSAGRRGLEIELSPANLCQLTGGRFADIARYSA